MSKSCRYEELAPTPAIGDSVADILKEIGLEHPGAPGTTAADEQVSAILEVELFQIRIALVVVTANRQWQTGCAGLWRSQQ